jgi:hypothetical protein
MKKQNLLAVLVIVAVLSTVSICQAQTISKPNVTIPSGWRLDDETAYPNAPSEHDSAGAGMLKYLNPTNNDEVRIFYEKAPTTTYTSATLKEEAISLFTRDLPSYNMSESGTEQIAGVQAGFAKGYDSANDAYVVDMIFVKDGNYYNVAAYYDANSQSEGQVNSILNSISTGATLGSSMLFIIIGVVAAVVVIVVVVVVMRRRKKPVAMQEPQVVPESSYPPPPPPPA